MSSIIIPGQERPDDEFFNMDFTPPKELEKIATPPPSAKTIRLKAKINTDHTGPLLSFLDILKEHQVILKELIYVAEHIQRLDRQIAADYLTTKQNLPDVARQYLDTAEETLEVDIESYVDT